MPNTNELCNKKPAEQHKSPGKDSGAETVSWIMVEGGVGLAEQEQRSKCDVWGETAEWDLQQMS